MMMLMGEGTMLSRHSRIRIGVRETSGNNDPALINNSHQQGEKMKIN